jgi:hypothetical protein
MGFGDITNNGLGATSANVNTVGYNPTTSDYDAQRKAALAQMGQGAGGLQQAQGLYSQAALGNTPSVAQLQLQGGQEDAARQAAQLAASARGTGGQLMAENSAQAQNAMGQQTANYQSAMLRANEMAQARQGLMQTAQAQNQLGAQYGIQSNAQNMGENEAALKAAMQTQQVQEHADTTNIQGNNQYALKNFSDALSGGSSGVATLAKFL